MLSAQRLADVARRFAAGDTWFDGSPLYQSLARTVARDPDLIALAAESRGGQQPPNLLMAATHLLVLRDPSLPLARFFPSAGGDRDPEGAGPAFAAFCAEHRAELTALLHARLVQTNAAGRGVALRLALHAVGRRVGGPVTLVEVGASAGIQLCFDRWGVDTDGRAFGPADARVRLACAWQGPPAVPDLDRVPPIARRLGMDLAPVDASDPDERAWLRALIWPEEPARAAQLLAALDGVAADPPELRRGDAVDLLPVLDDELPADVPVVVWHSAVRMHVPEERRDAFDAAIAALGRRRRLLHVSFEIDLARPSKAFLLRLTDSAGPVAELATGHGHGAWLRPLDRS